MIALFKQKSPANIVLLLIFGLVIKLPLFLYPRVIAAQPDSGKLYGFLVSFVNGTGSNALLASLVSILLLYVQALIINYIVNEYRMTNRQTFLPGMAYLLITSLLPEWNYLSPALVAATPVIWSFSKLFKLYNVESAHGNIYNTGLIIGLASFIYFPSLFFSICILLGLMILRPFRVNELVVLLLGTATPFYFYSVYLFLTDSLSLGRVLPLLHPRFSVLTKSLWVGISTVLVCTPFLLGGYYVQTHLRKMLIQARKNWSILLIYLLFSLFIPLSTSNPLYTNWVIIAAPFAAFHACTYLYPPRKWFSALLFTVMIAYIWIQQFATTAWQ